MNNPIVSLVIPIYNEEALLPVLHDAVAAALEGLEETCEVIYVNDGSGDRSREVLLEIQERDRRVVVADLTRNWGHQAALTAGLNLARGRAVVLMDGDMQDPPSVIPHMIEAWRKGAEVVVAERRTRRESGLRAWLFPAFYKVMGLLSDYPIPLNAGIFGLLDRRAVDSVNQLGETNRYLPGLRAWVGYKTSVVHYDRQARAGGEPKQGLLRLTRYALDAIFSFSYKPLRISMFAGTAIACFALMYGVILIGLRLSGRGMFGIPVVNGYTSTIMSVLFLGGVQLISIGILGEYLGRIYDEVKRRPLFLLREVHRRDP